MSVRNEAYLHARVSVMMGRLLTPTQIEAMLSRPLPEQEEMIGSAQLSTLFPQTAAAPLLALEQRIIASVLDDFRVLIRPLTGAARDFLMHWVHRLELSNLKAILRGKLAGRSIQDIRSDLLDVGSFTTLPIEQLLRTEDFSELLRQLETTTFADIARQARVAFETEHDLFAVDATVDRRYFSGVVARAGRLETDHGRLFRALVGSILDRVNLVWLLRYRFVYQLPAAQTFYLLVSSSYRLNTQRLAELVKLEAFEEVLAALPEPLQTLLAGAHNPFEVTQRMEQLTTQAAQRALHYSPSALTRAFAYLICREFDLRKVRAIAKAQILQLDVALATQVLGLAAPAATVH